MNVIRRSWLFALCALACAVALAQPAAAPPPLPKETSPLGPPVAQPPLPAPSPGTLTQTPRAVEATAGEPAPSRWQGALDQLDADLRLRLMTATAPPAAWLAGELDETDIANQVRHYAQARTAAPDVALYQASLATACLVRTQPPLPECDAMDRLADWARRDRDNAVPSILLADRARQRGEIDLAAADLEQAAIASRVDDYWSQGALHWWNYLRPLPLDFDPTVKAKAAANYATSRDITWAPALRALCIESAAKTPAVHDACAKLGDTMMKRGATFALQRAGARIAEANARDPAARKAAQTAHARIIAATARCAQAQPDFASGFESAAAETRARAVEQFGAWASAQARDGEVAACAKLAAAK
jgi:hypothetical protein